MSSIKHQKPSQSNSLCSTFNSLKIYTSKLANFTLQWHDLEDHFRSIKTQLQELEKTHKIQNGDDTKKPPFQHENENPETKIKDNTVQPQNKNPEREHYVNTARPSVALAVALENGKSLLLYLNKHVKKPESLQSYVHKAIKDVSNPRGLVLQALRFFYPSDSRKSDMDVDVGCIRKICVVLLEEMIKVGSLVGSEEREEATRMALEWKGKIPVNIKNSLEVLGFLMLLAAFGLVAEFDKDELLTLVGKVAKLKHAPDLFRALGFANEAHAFVQKLIKQAKRLEAVQFIFAFELVDKFPPVSLLREHSEYAKKITKMICNKGNNSFTALDNATNSQIAALRAVIKLIEKYKLHAEYSPDIIRNEIRELRKQKNVRPADETAPDPMIQPEQQTGNKRTAPSEAQPIQRSIDKRLRTAATVASTDDSINATAMVHLKQPSQYRIPIIQPEQQTGNKHTTPSGAQPNQHSADKRKAAPTTASTDDFIGATTMVHLKQPSEYRIGSVQYLIPAAGKAAPATDVTGVSTSAASHTQHMDLVVGPYRSGGSALANHHLSSTAGQYSLLGTTSVRSHVTSSLWPYGTDTVRNGNIGLLGLAGSPRPMGITSNLSSYKSTPYYSGEAGSYFVQSSSGSNFGALHQGPSSIYHL